MIQWWKKSLILKTISFLFIFISMLGIIRLLWFHVHQMPTQPEAENGVINLRSLDFNKVDTVTLNGEWSYYPNKLIMPGEKELNQVKYKFVPNKGEKLYPIKLSTSNYQYGTYKLKILLPSSTDQTYAVRLPSINTAAKVYINGVLKAQHGNPSVAFEGYKANSMPDVVVINDRKNEMEIIIQYASYSYISEGIHKPIILGVADSVLAHSESSKNSQVIVSVIFLLHCTYALIIYFMGKRKKELLYFALLLFTANFTILLDDDKLLLTWIPLDYEWSRKMIFLAYAGLTYYTIKFCTFYLTQLNNRVFLSISRILFILSVLIVVLPVNYLSYTGFTVVRISLYTFLIISVYLFVDSIKGNRDMIILLLAITSIMSSFIWGGVPTNGWSEVAFYPFDMIMAILVFACYLFLRYIRSSKQNELMTEKLKKVDKMKDDFLANTSHELKNPLHGIINVAQAIIDDKTNSLSTKSKGSLELLINVGRHMSYTLNDLLDITRIKENRINLDLKRVDLWSISTAVINMIEFMMEGKKIEIRQTIPDHFPKVLADENRVTQILFNLIQNAVKYTDGGLISVSAVIKGKMVAVSVEDTGIGIAEEWQHIVFMPYEQVDSTITSRGNGIGLGLSISKELVELQGGKLTIHSVPKAGSTFTFTLPLATESSTEDFYVERPFQKPLLNINNQIAATSIENEKITPASRKRILAVDDNIINLKILMDILSGEYIVQTATSGEEALHIIETGNWDLVISDVMMPNLSGYELTSKIRQRYTISELPVLLLTARTFREDIYTGFMSGANDYVVKPVDAMELKSRVNALISMKISIEEQLRMEAAWLQAQIQPHFLYNTINAIASLSDTDSDRMINLLLNFGNYLQRSYDLSNLNEQVHIQNELNLIKSYLYIEKERFGERLKIKWEIDENLQVTIPPLSIQPLVENAVKHGVLRKMDGGVICVRAKEYESYIKIDIIDSGAGMDEMKVKEILEGEKEKWKGIGVANTNRRLKKLYGRGLSINSIPGKGTTVTFQIPQLPELSK